MAHPRSHQKEKIAVLGFALLLSGCATVDVPNVGQAGYKVEADEARMFKRADEVCEELGYSDYVHADPALDEYLNRLATGLLPQDVKDAGLKVKVQVLREPTLNAFAFPNGNIYLHLGILAAVDNEAQLAALIGHEMTHVVNRHQLKFFRSVTNKTAFFATIYTPAAVAGGGIGSIAVQLGALSSITGYSQDLEYEADELGFRMVLDKGYDVAEAPKLFGHLQEFIKAEDVKVPFFFSTHPNLQARINNFSDLMKKHNFLSAPGQIVDTPEFAGFRSRLVKDQVQLCFQEGYFRTAEKHIERLLTSSPDDTEAHFLKGELFRQRQDHEKKVKQRDKMGDYPAALEAYDKALALDPMFAPALKGKARALQKQGKPAEAKEFFSRYLQADPNASDKAYVEQYINQN